MKKVRVLGNKLICKQDIGTLLEVYNGKIWQSVLVTEGMWMHTIGEFFLTKYLGREIHLKKRKKNKKK